MWLAVRVFSKRSSFTLRRLCVAALLPAVLATNTWASTSLTDLTGMEAAYPVVGTSNPISRSIQQYTGINFLASWAGSKILEKKLAEKLQGDVDVSIKPFSGMDLFAGKAHQLTVHGTNITFNKFIPFTKLHIETDQETPIFLKIQKKPTALRPIRARMSAEITEEDLNRIFLTPKGKKHLTRIKLKLPPIGEQRFDFLEPKARIEEGKLVFSALMNVSGAPVENAVPITAEGRLVPDNDQQALRLKDLKITSEGMDNMAPIAGFIEGYFGKVVKFSRIKVKGHMVSVQMEEPQVADDKLVLQGVLTVIPKPLTFHQVAKNDKK